MYGIHIYYNCHTPQSLELQTNLANELGHHPVFFLPQWMGYSMVFYGFMMVSAYGFVDGVFPIYGDGENEV